MFKPSKTSQERLSTCCPEIQLLFKRVLYYIDYTVACGFRGEEDQDKAFADGFSKVKWPNSKHNKLPSEAIDIYPYVNGRMVNGDEEGDREQIIYNAGYIKCLAKILGINICWFGDRNNDNVLDKDRWDLAHWEVISEK